MQHMLSFCDWSAIFSDNVQLLHNWTFLFQK